jgi:molybdopterin synthase catalytic subunit
MHSNIHTSIQAPALNIVSAYEFIADPGHGGTSVFQGTVRNYNFGKEVLGVSYDVYEPLAIKSFTDLSVEAIKQWGEHLKIYITHAAGRLNVNDISIIIAVSAVHRDEAFKACRFLIEGIKHQSPIWKQEHYIDGNSEWVQGHALCQH